MKGTKYFLYIFSVLLVTWACKREDDEPRKAKKPISRMYVSTSDYNPSSGDAQLRNIFVIDPADSTDFTSQGALRYDSGAKGGGVIHFSAFARSVFHAGINSASYIDTTIRMQSVNDKGQLAPAANIGNRKFDRVRGLWYHNVDNLDQLLISNNGDDTVSVFVVNRPKYYNGFAKYAYQVKLEDRIWGMQLDSTHLLLSKIGNDGGILVFKDFVDVVNSKRDTLVEDIRPTYRLTVPGSKNIRGFFYAKTSDILVLSDYESSGVGARVLVFEHFSQYKTNATIQPTRVISGASTLLQEPLSVTMDGKENPKYIYVSDVGAKRIFRFKLEDSGDVAPDKEMTIGNNQTPQSIFLDSRGVNEY